MSKSNSIEKSRKNVMMRIAVFVLYYILMLVLSLVLLLAVLVATGFVLYNLPYLMNRLGIAVLLILGSIWMFVFRIGWGLLRSPFIVTKYERDDHIEVTEHYCPELFKIIREVAAFTGCEMPKHVYLCSDVNACLFYNTSFWNIFLPVKKQLEIGVGLMNGMSSDELKAIIAHEFGHYTQKTGKIDGLINRSVTVLDNMMRNLRLPWYLQNLTFKVYRFVQRGNLRFSRQLEYNADSVACACVGKEVFVSAMCKVEILADRQNAYERVVANLLQDKKVCDDYWSGYERLLPCLEKNDAVRIEYSQPMLRPFNTPAKLSSRLKVNDIWSTHPSLEDRISEANKLTTDATDNEGVVVDSKTLFPQKILLELGRVRLNVIKQQTSVPSGVESISIDQFAELAEERMSSVLLQAPLVPFLHRDFFSLVEDAALNSSDCEMPENPFTVENMLVIKRYQSALNDLKILQDIQDGKCEVTEFLYNGTLCTKKNNPIETQKSEVESLRPEAAKVDNAIVAFLLSNGDVKDLVVKNYNIVRYTQKIFPRINYMLEVRNNLIAALNAISESGRQLGRSEYNNLLKEVEGLYDSISAITNKMDFSLLSEWLNADSIAYLSDYHNTIHCSSTEIVSKQINAMSRLVTVIYELHMYAYNHSTGRVIQEIQKLFPAQSQHDILEYIQAQHNPDYSLSEDYLDAEYMERVKNSETINIVLWLIGEFAVIIALVFIIQVSIGKVQDWSKEAFFTETPVSALPGEKCDGVIAFKVPAGFECEYVEPTEDAMGSYRLSSAECIIEIFDGYQKELSQKDCVRMWYAYADSREIPTETLFKKNTYDVHEDMAVFCRQIELINEEDNEYIWEFKVIYDLDCLKYAIVSTFKSSQVENDIDITKDIRLR